MEKPETPKKRISVQSAKSKGRKLQQRVRDDLIAAFPSLTEDDVRSCSMGSNGADVILSTAAKKLIPYEFECKSKARGFTPLYDALKQAEGHGGLEPVAVVKQDRCQPLAVIPLALFVKLIGGGK